MRKTAFFWAIYLFILVFPAGAESFRVLLGGSLDLSADNPEGSSINLPYNGAVSINLGSDTRFLRGVELEISAPQAWLSYRGSLAMMVYVGLDRQPSPGINDLEGERAAFEPLPGKIKNVYQIPVRRSHGLKTSPYAIVPVDAVLPSSFPILVQLVSITKGLSEELEAMRFALNAKPILSDEGALSLSFRYPDQLKDRPFTVLIDDVVMENLTEDRLFREGEHHLVVLSDDYRNENRRFLIEKAKKLDIVIELQDTTPIIIFEAPENARIFLNNAPVRRNITNIPVEPGVHEARFQVGDYTLTKTITVQRGKTYRVALSVDIDVEEND